MEPYRQSVAPEHGPRIAAIGGGTGLSTLLRGLKRYTKNITAIVTVADDGGGSGRLRQDLGMLPPGDIRNCLEALANAEPLMAQLMHYRFPEGIQPRFHCQRCGRGAAGLPHQRPQRSGSHQNHDHRRRVLSGR